MVAIYVCKTEEYENYGSAASCSIINTYTENLVPCAFNEDPVHCASAEAGPYTIFTPDEDSLQLDSQEFMTVIGVMYRLLSKG